MSSILRQGYGRGKASTFSEKILVLDSSHSRRTYCLRKNGCWLAAQILYFLLKPNTILENEVRKAKEKLNWNRDSGKCVAVHVRHGWRSL